MSSVLARLADSRLVRGSPGVGEGGVHLRQCQIRILLDDLGGTLAMGHVIRNDVHHPVAGAVNTQDPTRIDCEMRIRHDIPSV